MVHLVERFKKRFSSEIYEKEIEEVKRENNPKKLAEFARCSNFSNVRLEATWRIVDEVVLADIVRNDSNKKVRMAAIGKIHDESVLADIASNDSNRQVRKLAENRLAELGYS